MLGYLPLSSREQWLPACRLCLSTRPCIAVQPLPLQMLFLGPPYGCLATAPEHPLTSHSLTLPANPATHPPSPPLAPPAEDYHWWWRAYLTSGSSALYLFLYSLFYFYTKLDITKLVPALMYFGERRAAGGVDSWRAGRLAAGRVSQQFVPSHPSSHPAPTFPTPLPNRLHDHRVGHLLLPHRHNRLL